jgi:site-specific DNA-cytosine methylase
MNELSLFTGAGGGVYGTKLLGHRIVGYVEWDKYCQQVISARIRDGIFDDAPIFGDIRAFTKETVDSLSTYLYNTFNAEKEEGIMGARRKDYDEAVTLYK